MRVFSAQIYAQFPKQQTFFSLFLVFGRIFCMSYGEFNY